MKIGKVVVPRTAICTSTPENIVVRGKELSRDLIGQVGFVDYFWLLVTGSSPSRAASAAVNACMVAIAEHGMVPSVQAARMTLAAAPDAMQGAVAAGLLGCGSVILGATETAARLFLEVEQEAQAQHGGDLRAAAHGVITRLRAHKQPIAGYGHPEHKEGDPRVKALFDVARAEGVDLRYVELAQIIESVIPEVVGKELKLNVSAAIPALLLGVGLPLAAFKGVPMLARTASLIAHLCEEQENPCGFALAYQAGKAVEYTGPALDSAAQG
jgi:citrate synthase